ncbi:MAG: GFA family protein [Acidimicrobiales bacterium]|jgi:hypothetical protein|nr:GFA family protein [Acidimicrobiales bacterium]
MIAACHCDFGQKRTGSVFQVAAYFGPDEPFEIVGETRACNGMEMDGVPSVRGAPVTYHFCPTCDSTRCWDEQGSRRAVPVGNVVDPNLPAPTMEVHTADRHQCVPAIPGAQQFPAEFG